MNRDPQKLKELAELGKRQLGYEEFEDYVNKNAEEATPVDFYVVSHQNKPADIYPAQAKIFGMDLDPSEINEKFIEFLEAKNQSYGNTETTLFVHFRNKGSLSFKPIQNWLTKNEIRFREVAVHSLDENMRIKMSQLYPVSDQVVSFEFEPKDYLN